MVDETITVGSIEEPVEDSEEEISDEENDENEIDNELDIDDGTSCRSVAAVDVEDLGINSRDSMILTFHVSPLARGVLVGTM